MRNLLSTYCSFMADRGLLWKPTTAFSRILHIKDASLSSLDQFFYSSLSLPLFHFSCFTVKSQTAASSLFTAVHVKGCNNATSWMDKLSDWNRWDAQARVIPTPTTHTSTLAMTNCIFKIVEEKILPLDCPLFVWSDSTTPKHTQFTVI